MVALGLGVLTVLGMFLIQGRLTAQLDAELPDQAPTVFLIDIQPDQWSGVRSVLSAAGAEDLQSVEVVMAQSAVDQLGAGGGAAPGDRSGFGRPPVGSDPRTTADVDGRLPDDNVILEGALWSVPDRAEVSIERDFADDLGVEVGDSLIFWDRACRWELLRQQRAVRGVGAFLDQLLSSRGAGGPGRSAPLSHRHRAAAR